MADKSAIRAYENDRNRHSAAALRYLQDVAEASARLVERWNSTSPALAAGEAERIAKDAMAAWVRASQYDALHEVSFLAVPDESAAVAAGEAGTP